MSVISIVVTSQSRDLAEREIAALEAQLIATKREELKNYLSIARTAFVNTYGRAAPDDEDAKREVSQVLAAILYGQDGYFFVFDYEGTNLVAPRQTYLINRNWSGLHDDNGVPITDELIRIAHTGGGYHSFDWPKPTTGETGRMIVYVNGLQDWRWVVGTGIFIDDVQATVASARAEVEDRIAQTSLYIVVIVIVALIGVFLSGFVLNIRERRLADVKLKALTQRIIDTQEEERGRVARELHDGISQMLVGVRYALELTKRRFHINDDRVGESLTKGIDGLGGAIQEVRRISRDLRPSVLDDLSGLNATEMILEKRPETRILILSMHNSPEYISTALSHGAKGYVLKDVPTEEIKTAIETVMAGGQYLCTGAKTSLAPRIADGHETLTGREQTILLELAQGQTNKDVAASLNISVRTVETHRNNIKRKLGISSTAGLTRYAMEHGVLQGTGR